MESDNAVPFRFISFNTYPVATVQSFVRMDLNRKGIVSLLEMGAWWFSISAQARSDSALVKWLVHSRKYVNSRA